MLTSFFNCENWQFNKTILGLGHYLHIFESNKFPCRLERRYLVNKLMLTQVMFRYCLAKG